ncbi:MAG: type II secretion system protein M [Gammaproteobacteria bacterium]|nr:type II secretion system protein M [Gammaproteobacteria bacterium]MDH5344867.1 type II secretion system protein M [Gammaproteobacteria bacterium]
MKQWFTSLQARERAFVAGAAAFIVLAGLWFGLWVPLDKGHSAALARVDTWQRSLSALRPMRGQVQAAASGRPAAGGQNQSLVVIVDNSLRQRGLTGSLQRSQPTPSGDGIRVEFENAAFDDLVLWLGDLHRQFGLEVESGSFSVASSDSPGRVNSSVTLQR